MVYYIVDGCANEVLNGVVKVGKTAIGNFETTQKMTSTSIILNVLKKLRGKKSSGEGL